MDTTAIRDRIVELRRVPAAELRPNPRNWRTHPKAQRDVMAGLLAEIGYADAVLARETPDGLELIDGHLRAETTPDAVIPVLVLDVDEDEATKILLTHDPVATMAEANRDALDALLAGVRFDDPGVMAMLEAMAGADASPLQEYVQAIVSPIYEPSGVVPSLGDLYDTTATDRLVADIEAMELSPDLAAFLTAAAQRHTVIHFDRVANYYAAAPAEVQRLIEDSALVIVDSARAIERGFLRLHEAVNEAFAADHPDA